MRFAVAPLSTSTPLIVTVGWFPACVVIATVVSMIFLAFSSVPWVWMDPRTIWERSTDPVTAYSVEGAITSPYTSCAAVSPYSFGASATLLVLPSPDDFGVSPLIVPQ